MGTYFINCMNILLNFAYLVMLHSLGFLLAFSPYHVFFQISTFPWMLPAFEQIFLHSIKILAIEFFRLFLVNLCNNFYINLLNTESSTINIKQFSIVFAFCWYRNIFNWRWSEIDFVVRLQLEAKKSSIRNRHRLYVLDFVLDSNQKIFNKIYEMKYRWQLIEPNWIFLFKISNI